MSAAPLVQAIETRLHNAGYESLSTPFRVAGVEFAFTGAMRGKDGRSLDLVLVVDTATGAFGDRDGASVRQRIEALSRALDITGSRYVLTAILAGAVLAEGVETLSETCRVLQVDGIILNEAGRPVDEAMEHQLDDRIRVLLPLTLPPAVLKDDAEAAPVMAQLMAALPETADRIFIEALLTASEGGENAVTDAASAIINDAFDTGAEEAAS